MLFLLATLGLGCGSTPTEPGETRASAVPLVREVDRTLHARTTLMDARIFRREGRLEAAERTLQRGLWISPDNPRLNWMMGEILDELGREGGDVYRRRADAIAPPPPPLPDQPLETSGEGVVVVLVPPHRDDIASRLIPVNWPDDQVAGALEGRLAIRLPIARVVHADPKTVDAARIELRKLDPTAVISLRVERAYCGNTLKDGRFAIGQLRIAAEHRGRVAAESGPATSREVVSEPRLEVGCKIEAIARALESAFSLPAVGLSLGGGDPAGRRSSTDWPTESIRALFPGLGERIEEHLETGRDLLGVG